MMKGICQWLLRPIQSSTPFRFPVLGQVPHVGDRPSSNMIRVWQRVVTSTIVTRRSGRLFACTIPSCQFRHEIFGFLAVHNILVQVGTERREVALVIDIVMPEMIAISKVIFIVIPVVRCQQDGVHGFGQFGHKGILQNDHFAIPQPILDIRLDGGIFVFWIENIFNGFGFRYQW